MSVIYFVECLEADQTRDVAIMWDASASAAAAADADTAVDAHMCHSFARFKWATPPKQVQDNNNNSNNMSNSNTNTMRLTKAVNRVGFSFGICSVWIGLGRVGIDVRRAVGNSRTAAKLGNSQKPKQRQRQRERQQHITELTF